MGHRTRIQNLESAIQIHSESPAPNGLSRGHLHSHIASDRGQRFGIAAMHVLRTQSEQSVEGGDERHEHVIAVHVPENLRKTDRVLGSPSHVQAETDDDMIGYIACSVLD